MKQKTVVITGASSGIGMEFARAFSKTVSYTHLDVYKRQRYDKTV